MFHWKPKGVTIRNSVIYKETKAWKCGIYTNKELNHINVFLVTFNIVSTCKVFFSSFVRSFDRSFVLFVYFLSFSSLCYRIRFFQNLFWSLIPSSHSSIPFLLTQSEIFNSSIKKEEKKIENCFSFFDLT